MKFMPHDAEDLSLNAGADEDAIVRNIQDTAFENAELVRSLTKAVLVEVAPSLRFHNPQRRRGT